MPVSVVALVLLFTSILSAQQTQQKAAEAKFEPENFFMAIFTKSGNYDQKKAEPALSQHRAYWQSVAERGDLYLGGPISGHEPMSGVLIYKAANADDAAKLANSDPMLKAEQWTVAVHPWLTQKGVLQPLKKLDPASTYYLGFLRRGPKFTPEDSPERQRIQEGHMANISRLHELGKLVAAGPFTDDGDLRGIFVFKVATAEEANELTNTDPAVQSGRLKIELHPWVVPAEAFAAQK